MASVFVLHEKDLFMIQHKVDIRVFLFFCPIVGFPSFFLDFPGLGVGFLSISGVRTIFIIILLNCSLLFLYRFITNDIVLKRRFENRIFSGIFLSYLNDPLSLARFYLGIDKIKCWIWIEKQLSWVRIWKRIVKRWGWPHILT